MERDPFTHQYARLCLRLALARRRAGLSREALAARLGWPPSFVHAYEMRGHRLDMEALFQVAAALELDRATLEEWLSPPEV